MIKLVIGDKSPDFKALTHDGNPVGLDREASYLKFIKKYVLPFALIPDIEKKIIRDYGAWG